MQIKIIKSQDLKLLKRAFKYIKPYFFKLSFVFICIVSTIIFGIVQPLLSGRIIVFLTSKNISEIIINLEYIVILYVMNIGVGYIQSYILSLVNNGILYDICHDMYRKILDLPLRVFDNKAAGEFISRMQKDTSELAGIFTSQLLNVITTIIKAIFIGITIFSISTQLSFIILAAFPVSYIIFNISGKILRKRQDELKKLFDRYYSHLHEIIISIREIKSLNLTTNNIRAFDSISKTIKNKQIKVSLINTNVQSITGFISIITEVLVIIIGGYLALNNQIGMEYFIAFLSYSKQFSSSLISLTQINSNLQQSIVSLQRIFELMDNFGYPYEYYGRAKLSDFVGDIKFDNVYFEYKLNESVLNNVNIHIKPGSKVAFVGKSGSGKTTIFNLIMRLYKPSKGKIFIDNVDISQMDESYYKEHITIVRQEPVLFNMSIIDNLLLVNPHADQGQIIQACKSAYIHDFIMNLPNGYNTVVGDRGFNLSCGQRQRVAIARALLKGSEVILFDESTSSLDNESQYYINKVINETLHKHTVVIIAHRLFNVIDADKIYVIDNGNISGVGTHNSLIRENHIYQNLYKIEMDMIQKENLNKDKGFDINNDKDIMASSC